MNLVLIGYRGTGKSTLADSLHIQLDMPVYHMDEMLESRFGEKIASFVKKHGWDSFREEEQMLVEELSALENVIIDCGGGVVTRDSNIRNLKKCGYVVWLQASPETISLRISHDANRPSLSGSKSHTDEISEVLNQRISLYQAAADFIVNTDENSIDECLRLIASAWMKTKK